MSLFLLPDNCIIISFNYEYKQQTAVELAMPVTLSPIKITDIFVSCLQLLQISQNIICDILQETF